MSIKIVVRMEEQQRVAETGAISEDGKSWVIPDTIPDINPFSKWLPDGEGHIVQRQRSRCDAIILFSGTSIPG